MRVMVLGATGMLGNAMFRVLSAESDLTVWGTARGETALKHFSSDLASQIIVGIDVENQDSLVSVFSLVRPDVVINCVGLIKQRDDGSDPLRAVPINTLLPHRLAALCRLAGARLVHISTDCVFSGHKGDYLESDFPDADDLYGRSKLLGELDYPHAITLRTSMIGRELSEQRSLVGWFLAQRGPVRGFSRAVFSGLPTVELAQLVCRHVLPRADLHGLYHVAAKPINKFDLLTLIARIYGTETEIVPSDDLVIDRSLNAGRFNSATGYVPAEWPVLVQRMHDFN